MFAITSLLVGIFTAPINLFVDLLFEILNSPISESISLKSKNARVAIIQKGQEAIRRASVSVDNVIRTMKPLEIVSSKSSKIRKTKILTNRLLNAHGNTVELEHSLIRKLKTVNEQYSRKEINISNQNGVAEQSNMFNLIKNDNSLGRNIKHQRAFINPNYLSTFDNAWG